MKFGLTEKDCELIQNVFEKYPEIEKVEVFGSRAMGNEKPGSDVDLVIYASCDHAQFTQIKSELENDLPLPYIFDVVLWNDIQHAPFKEHIKNFGRVFYQRKPVEKLRKHI